MRQLKFGIHDIMNDVRETKIVYYEDTSVVNKQWQVQVREFLLPKRRRFCLLNINKCRVL